uniref:AAA family ATPase n=1 Tax=Candidatus Albibeggiatoa sp. nov. BB20 TaxID=3162723 RepID=UPI00336556EB
MSTLETLISYTPALVQRHHAHNPEQQPAPTSKRYESALLMIEIIGFSQYAQQASPQLNLYFEHLIDLLTHHGGEVVKLFGDTMLAVWTVDISGKDLATVTRRAAACALALKQSQHTKLELDLHIRLGADNLWAATIGGAEEHWEFLVASPVLQQLYIPQNTDKILIAKETWSLLRNYAKGQEFNPDFIQLDKLSRPLKPRHLPRVDLPPESEQLLKRYVSPVVLAQMELAEQWTGQPCEVSLLCLNLPNLDYTQSDILAQLQDLIYEFQSIISHHQGNLIELIQHGTGTLLVTGWGFAQFDRLNSLRAIQTAQKLQNLLTEQQIDFQIGLSAGQVFCGHRGNAKCRHFDVMGLPMQLALGLSLVADNKILCDDSIYQTTQNLIDYEYLPPVTHLSPEPLALYSPLNDSSIIGRRAARHILSEQLSLLHQQAQGSVVLIEGKAGIGKTRLIEDVVQQTQSAQFYYTPSHRQHLTTITCLICHAEQREQDTLYYVWRSLFTQILNYEFAGLNSAKQCSEMLRRIQNIPALAARFPLLNHLLPLQLPENRLTEQMKGQVRMDNTHALVIALLQDLVKHSSRRYVFIFENLHWLDSCSRLLLQRVVRRVQPLLIILATRPVNLSLPQLETHAHFHTLQLQGLETDETHFLLAQHLNVTQLPLELVDFIQDKTVGNPLFSEVLLHWLQQSGVIHNMNGMVEILIPLDEVACPTQLNHALSAYFQVLNDTQQVVLKASSVIGREIHLRLLSKLYSLITKREGLHQALDRLKNKDFLRNTDNSHYVQFKHELIQDTAYQALLRTQKIQLHRTMARWYEKAADLKGYYNILAYHWENAEMPDKAIEYYEKAGEQALNNDANTEAVNFFLQTIELDQAQIDQATPLKRASWYLLLGTAYLYLGKLGESQYAFHTALKVLKLPAPNKRWGLKWQTVRQQFLQLLHQRNPQQYLHKQEDKAHFISLGAQIYERLVQLGYLQQNAPLCFHASLAGLNLAESLPAQENQAILARSYAQMSLAMAMRQRPTQADDFAQKALDLAKQQSDLKTASWVFMLVGLYDVGYGRWQLGETRVMQALKSAEYLGDTRRQMESLNILTQMHYFQGDVRECLKKSQMIYMMATQHNDIQAQVWGLCQQGLCALRLGEPEAAVTCLKAIQALPSELLLHPEAVQVCGLLSLVYMQQGLPKQAVQMATKTAHLIEKIEMPSVELFEAYSSVALVYLTQWEKYLEQNPQLTSQEKLLSKERFAFAKLSRRACQQLQNYANLYLVAQPRAYLWQGLYLWLQEKERQAHHAWKMGLNEAMRLKMPYECGLAHYEIARHLEDNPTLRQQHIEKAKGFFTDLGAAEE